MKRIYSSKRGFTLVEMMLALAIIVIIGWTTVALMFCIKDSFMTTYNTNDSSDYAVLYANGIENAYLRHTQNKTSTELSIDPVNSILKDNGTQVFAPMQMKTTNVNSGLEVDKWEIRAYYKIDKTDGASVVKYKVFVVDNYYSPTYKIMCIHEDSVWAPHMDYGKVTTKNTLTSADKVNKFLRDKTELGLATDEWQDTLVFTA